eukprot:138957-Prymnesium_polylepis.1
MPEGIPEVGQPFAVPMEECREREDHVLRQEMIVVHDVREEGVRLSSNIGMFVAPGRLSPL